MKWLQVRQLEHQQEVCSSTFDTRTQELMHLLACARQDLGEAQAGQEAWKQRALAAESRWAGVPFCALMLPCSLFIGPQLHQFPLGLFYLLITSLRWPHLHHLNFQLP